jgi:CRISPR-associated protein Cas1
MVLKGRLGLETSRIPHANRHGMLWLSRGNLYVKNGTLQFISAGSTDLKPGEYAIPFQNISMIILAPGTTVTHDCLRLLARHGTGLIAVAEGGARMYSAPPYGPGDSKLARRQAYLWANMESRIKIAKKMYKIRMGNEELPVQDINALRGIEGSRMKESYKIIAEKYGIAWKGRRYNRKQPEQNDPPNQAINHIATAMEGAAMIAVAATGTLPQLGFIHEDASISFCLDIADLFRTSDTIPIAFKAVKKMECVCETSFERTVREIAIEHFKKRKIIPSMIDQIKTLLEPDDGNSNT